MTPAMSLPPPTSSALDEETARAEVYGLLAALYYAPPSAERPKSECVIRPPSCRCA